MKKILIALLIFIPCNTFAIGGFKTLSGDDLKMATKLKEELQLSERDSFDVYKEYLEEQFNVKDWSSQTYNNDSVNGNKISNSKTRILYLNMITDTRLVNIAITKFPIEKQLYIEVIETLPRKSSIVIEKYNELKKDSKYILGADKEEFALFSSNEFTSRVAIFVNEPAGAIQYRTLYKYDIKDE